MMITRFVHDVCRPFSDLGFVQSDCVSRRRSGSATRQKLRSVGCASGGTSHMVELCCDFPRVLACKCVPELDLAGCVGVRSFAR